MRNLIGTIGFAVVAALALPAAAQTGAAVVAKEPGMAGAAETLKIAATITAIDAATRAVTLKGPQGREVTLTAGDQVKNFAQLKVGDQVNIEYIEALTHRAQEGQHGADRDAPRRPARPARSRRAPGRHGREAGDDRRRGRRLDAKTQVMTLSGPQRTVELKVEDPEQFKLIAKGDRVEATYTEAMAIAVEPAKK